MRRYFLLLIMGLLAFGINAHAADQGKDAILGKWLTENGKSIVDVYHCGDSYCGKIIWLKEPLNKEGKPKMDIHNPDKSLRKRPVVGLEILKHLKFKGPNNWGDGKIYDPEKGKTYSCKAWMVKGGLKFRGYIGFSLLGRTTTWKRP